jgi:hypothetical protein
MHMLASVQDGLKYDYYEADGALRPIIPIELELDGERVFYNALIDSGADFCLFDSEMADALGVTKVASGIPVEVTGLGDHCVQGYEHRIKLCVESTEYETNVVFTDCELPSEYGVLGQRGFFSRFIVTMDYTARTIILAPRP